MQSHEITDRRPIASVFRQLGTLPVRWCVEFNVHPNTISITSVVVSVAAAACFLFAASLPMLGPLGVAFCLLRLYCNMLDGMVAIAASKASATGEIANELPDRISDVVVFAGAAYGMMCVPALGMWCACLLYTSDAADE